MNLKFLSIFTLLLLTLSGNAKAHTPLLRHYTVQDGLPSNTIYDIFQDSKGYIWFCTDQGVSRFDGTEFKNYTPNHGLPDTEIFRIREDDQHRYWMMCYNFKACYLFNDTVYNSSNDSLCRIIEQEKIAYESMFRDINRDWCLGGKKIGILKGNQLLMKLKKKEVLETQIFDYFIHDSKEYITIANDIYELNGNTRQRIAQLGVGPTLYHDGKLFIFKNDNGFMLEEWTYEHGLFRLKKKSKAPSKVHQFSTLPDGNILCCSETGMLIYDISKGELRNDSTIPGFIYANRTLRDRDGNQWLGTVTDGVYLKLRNTPYIINRQSGMSSNHIVSLKQTTDGAIIAGDGIGNVNIIRDNSIAIFPVIREGLRNRILFAYPIHKELLIAGGDMGIYTLNNKKKIVTKNNELGSCKAAVFKNTYSLFAGSGGAMRYDIPTGRKNKIWTQRTIAIAEDGKGIVWLGTLNGLYYYQHGKVYRYDRDPVLSGSRISSIAITTAGTVVAGTSTNGLFIIPDTDTPPFHLNQSNGLPSNSCKKVLTAPNDPIWYCSENGLYQIHFRNNRYTIYSYPLPEGLSGNRINDIAILNGQLYLATPDGIVVLNKKDNTPKSPLLYIESVNNISRSDTSVAPLILPYNKNNLQVKYTGIAYTGGKNVTYRYLLKGSEDTIFTNAQTINFSALKSGKYELLIWARNLQGPWTTQPASLHFTILVPWWRSAWAISLAITSLLGAMTLMYRSRIKKIRFRAEKTARNKQQMAELELKALRAQINPHFVFNALNAIQTYYSMNDELKANHYMTSFAQFIRKTLTHSESHWLSIAEEIEMLQTYIELEQMRFKQLFTYTITLSPKINPEEQVIPAMLIQPYVENAINHGLRHLRDRKGILSLHFELNENNLTCIVEDNGVGFRQARQKRSGSHQSQGMSINRQRITTINELYRTNISISITDQLSDNGSNGTIITLLIPLKNEQRSTDYPTY